MGVTKSEFATAAVAYFTERELNPMSDRVREGMLIQNRVNDRADRLEQQIAALGNRLFGFLQTSEKTVMSFLVEQEKTMLAPLVEHVLRAGIDAYFGRQLSEQILLKQHYRLGEYDAKHAKQNEKVTTELMKRLLEFKPTPIRRKQDSSSISSTAGSPTTPAASVAVTPNTPPPSDTC